jgi:glycosyltransferase involved in cell wall biosynthesis
MRQTPEGGRILYVGDPNPYKMIETAITGLGLVRQVLPAARLFLTVPQDHRFSRVPLVSCIGYLGPFELREAYELADMLILPSLVESGPQPPLEAMSAGKPVLIADRPYARDIFGDAALRFDPLDAKDFAKKALCILSDLETRERLVKRGYQLVKERYEAKPYQRMVDICYETFVAKQAERRNMIYQDSGAPADGTRRESER